MTAGYDLGAPALQGTRGTRCQSLQALLPLVVMDKLGPKNTRAAMKAVDKQRPSLQQRKAFDVGQLRPVEWAEIERHVGGARALLAAARPLA
jgi:hypothetical protein